MQKGETTSALLEDPLLGYSPKMIRVTEHITIEDWEITESFMRASGPGGQHVNKTSSAVELRFEAERSPNLPPYVKAQLKRNAGRRWTKDGAVIIRSEKHRSQPLNREDALTRLIALIKSSTIRQKRRIKTRPSRSSQARRMDKKTQRGQIKSLRGRVREE